MSRIAALHGEPGANRAVKPAGGWQPVRDPSSDLRLADAQRSGRVSRTRLNAALDRIPVPR